MIMSCGGNKQKGASTDKDTAESFEVKQIKKGMCVKLDSLTALWVNLKPSAVYKTTKDGKIVLSDKEKKVKPDYLFTPDGLANKLETLSSKYRAISVFFVDREIANLYGMEDVYSPAMKKIAADLNDPAIKFIYDNGDKMDYVELQKKAYDIEEENGRANRFWEAAATSIIEQTYILAKNKEKYLAQFTDKDAEDITYQIQLLLLSFEDLSQHDPELLNLYNVIQPLNNLNAINVKDLREQLTKTESEIAKAREQLFF